MSKAASPVLSGSGVGGRPWLSLRTHRICETTLGTVTGAEFKEIWTRWGQKQELLSVPQIALDTLDDEYRYRLRIPMDLYIKLSADMEPTTGRARKRIEVRGIVQGVGFRPFVYTLAKRLGLGGQVRNHSRGVTVEVEGDGERLAQFVDRLRREPPPLAQIDSLETCDIPPTGDADFQIVGSATSGGASTPVSPDVATCADCLAELSDPGNRRYRYPFINCTNCGPRYTIVRDIPYDRPLTTMSRFAMCAACEREYRDPGDRRYHAQPNACPVCGPVVWFVAEPGADAGAEFCPPQTSASHHPVDAFHQAIEAGAVIAAKGIGGFHLACSAEDSTAIQKLRDRKGRGNKPFAIMLADVSAVHRVAYLDDDERRLLCSPARPIVLLRRRRNSGLSELVAPGNDLLGIMLPYSPLHALLVERMPLVMTSANLSEEPIVRTNEEAFARLRGLADGFLLHNRDIHVVCDDSIARVVRGRELPLRRSRGYAPMPVRLAGKVPGVLAVGGDIKAAFCVTKDDYAYMSPHIGDMGNLETQDAFQRSVEHFRRLFRVEPGVVACDLHPAYLSSQWARRYASDNGLELVEVQHHHAHISAVLAEHGCEDARRVIGISFDGTGYGPDGAIWGGEVLIASSREYERRAHLKYVPLPGGDAAVKHPYRVALAHLWAAGLAWDQRLPCVAHCTRSEIGLFRRQLERNLNCLPTSSMGRLFDAVAALIGVRQSVSYEAQASIEMESRSDAVCEAGPYSFRVSAKRPYAIDVAPMLAAISADVLAGVRPGTIISRFHTTVVCLIVDLCRLVRDESAISAVALGGGVFQNVLLLRRTVERLEEIEFEVLTHRIVPPNDGGLALGQAIAAARRCRN